jgi:hypothetical protein
MKKIFTLLFSFYSLSSTIAATPVLDGVITVADGWGTAVTVADGSAGWSDANAKTLYVTYDANYVYFAAEVRASEWMSWAFIVNTKAGGAVDDSWSRKITYNHANKPDFTFRGTFGGYAEYHIWNGVSWDGVTTSVAATEYAESVVGDANGAVEIRVSRAILGDISLLDAEFYITGNENDHGSFDSAPNDAIAQGWTPPTSNTVLANYASNVTLPVKLTEFKAVKDKNNVLINWTVAQESNIESYQVQRSKDGVNFSALQSVAARNQSTYQPKYSLTDDKPLNGVNYYRLLIKENGKMEMSKIITVTMGQKSGNISVNYIPGSNKVNIKLTGTDAGLYSVSVVSSAGQVVQNISLDHDGSEVNKAISLKGGLSKGIYRVVLMNADNKMSQAFLVQ